MNDDNEYDVTITVTARVRAENETMAVRELRDDVNNEGSASTWYFAAADADSDTAVLVPPPPPPLSMTERMALVRSAPVDLSRLDGFDR